MVFGLRALRQGTCVADAGTSLTTVPVERIEAGPEPVPLFDRTVADCHTYFVGGVLVHNKNF